MLPPAKHAIMTDIDGTLAIANNRRYSEFEHASTDIPDPLVRDMLYNLIRSGSQFLIVITGRPDFANCREDSERWIEKVANLPLELLLMRDANDRSLDTLVKLRLFRKHIAGNYIVDLVLEDKPSLISDVAKRKT